jgi:DNA-binding NarL/FixJ family response regulator
MRHLAAESDGDRTRPLRALVADDDPIARAAVRDALEDDGIVVVAEAATGREAVELTRRHGPDVVLMDLVMPGGDGIQATRRILARDPRVAVVLITASDNDTAGIAGLRAGATGFLCKRDGVAGLPRALRAAAAGEAVVSSRLTTRLVESIRRLPPDGAGLRPVHSPLTRREWEVLDLLCQGRSTDAIAEALGLAPDTVRSHIKNLLRKLGVSSRQAAVEEARRLRAGIAPVGASVDNPAAA